MGKKHAFDDYRSKRDLKKSPEPAANSKSNRRPIFVVQEHDASRHHFDFRLECNGALKSWAVSKGPSTDPREKRLAIEVEDHPLDYADFEGTIPEGEYGAGQVIVWDTGRFENTTEKDGGEIDLAKALKDGHATVCLHGKKLKGGYAITRILEGDKPQWLLVKMKDEEADARRNPVSTEPESVLSGDTIEDLKKEDDS
ncbi:DNA polymerase ligase N-terminal domain-containing protein [Haloferula sargassicola]|uniref:Multifunctional non-homologous end joining protein LigD n=1 Tax=Haloferula sargassicola TaxID=490096 RepID=A0ABP9UM54_9BACT